MVIISNLHGYIETVKNLIENDANIHVGNDYKIRLFNENEHNEAVKFLTNLNLDYCKNWIFNPIFYENYNNFLNRKIFSI